jgi:hypothetical protein
MTAVPRGEIGSARINVAIGESAYERPFRFLAWEHLAMLARLPRTILFPAVVIAASLSVGQAVAETALVPAQDTAIPLGGDRAQGAVI